MEIKHYEKPAMAIVELELESAVLTASTEKPGGNDTPVYNPTGTTTEFN